MINKVIGTVFSRFFITLLSLGIIIISSRQLGKEAVGTISLIILGITIVQMVNNLVGGPALIYLVPRTDTFKLLVPSYLWALFTAFACTFVLSVLNLIPAGFFWHILSLSLLLSLATINLNILLGKEKVKLFNIITSLQLILQISVLAFMIFYLEKKEVFSYIIALYASYLFLFLAAIISVSRMFKFTNLDNLKGVLKDIFKYGSFGTAANIFQLFNYRLTYYIIEKFLGLASLGIYSVGVQLSEGLWLTGKSMAIVQYSRISNTQDTEYAKKITLVFGKISFLITLLLLIIIILIPVSFFSFIFGKEFGDDLPLVIKSLASGILFLSFSFSLSHYFSGTGKIIHNSISSALGLIMTVSLGFLLIPEYGLIGAGIATSATYFSIIIYQVIVFMKISGTKFQELAITAADIKVFSTELKNWIKKK